MSRVIYSDKKIFIFQELYAVLDMSDIFNRLSNMHQTQNLVKHLRWRFSQK